VTHKPSHQLYLDRSIGFLVSDVARHMRREFGRRMKRYGLTPNQWLVLVFLYREDGLTQSELAEEVDMARAPLGCLIDKLEESGWVTRRTDKTDRRVKRIFLTTKLKPLIGEMRRAADEVSAAAFAGVAAEDLDHLIEMLQHAKTNLPLVRAD